MTYSIQRDVSNGSLQYLEVRIDYFAKEHLSVFIAEKLVPQGTTPDPISGYCWTWDGNRIKFNKAVANGLEVMVRRATPIAAPFHIFRQGAVFKDLTVDENFLQQLYINQENQEGQTTTDFYSDLNFHGYRLRNVGAAIHDYDAVPFSQYRADAMGAMQQRILAEQARERAVAAETIAVASKEAAGASAAAALASQNAAKTSETNAKASEIAAKASENAAASSATASVNSAASAKADADRAAQYNGLFIQNGTGAVTRTAQDKMRDVVSVKDFGAKGDGVTDDTAAIQAAVGACISGNNILLWPAGDYIASSGITGFHTIDHVGSGKILAGISTFYISPTASQTNTVYVSTSGSDSNDGLDVTRPLATVQAALNILGAPYIPRMLGNGTFKIKFSAGTWIDGGSFTGNVITKNWVYIEGTVDQNGIPLTVIDGDASTKTAGLYFDGGPSRLYVKDIKAINFRANSVASGFVFANKGIAQLFTDNLHTTNNLWAGINCDSIGQWNAKGGTHDGNTNYNLRARGGIAISIGRPDARITLKNCVTSVQIRDCCSGHFDYVDIVNHPTNAVGTGLWLTNVSRTVLNNCTVTNCNVGVMCENGSTFSYVNTSFTNVNTTYKTANNASKDSDSLDGSNGTGLAYDSFFNRYTIGADGWGGSPFSTVAHALCTSKSGTADFAYYVPNSTTARQLVGNVSNNAFFRQDWDFANSRITWVVNGNITLRSTLTDINSGTDNTKSVGTSAARWSTVYAGTGTINTSDSREKTAPLPIDDKVLDAWGDVSLISFQWLQAIQQKGADNARWHFGVIAQQVRDAFEARGIDGTRYGLLCYDAWDAVPEVTDEDGNVTQEAVPAGNRWGIRSDQCLFLEAAYQRRQLKRLEERLTKAGI